MLEVERRMHVEISRTTAAVSLIFILSITPWAFKEAVMACIGGKVIAIFLPKFRIRYRRHGCTFALMGNIIIVKLVIIFLRCTKIALGIKLETFQTMNRDTINRLQTLIFL